MLFLALLGKPQPGEHRSVLAFYLPTRFRTRRPSNAILAKPHDVVGA